MADRDRRHHDRQPARRTGPARSHGHAVARRRGRPCWPATTRDGCGRAPDGAPVRCWRAARSPGMLALRAGWPSMFRAYLHDEARYRRCFAGGWYLSGDLVRRDAAGYLLVRRPGGRRDQDGRPPDRPLRGRTGAAGPPRGGRGRRLRRARPGGRRRRPRRDRARAGPRRRRRPLRTCWPTPAAGSAPRWRPVESSSPPSCPRPAAARSCADVLRARELGLPEGDLSTLEPSPVRGTDDRPDRELLRRMLLLRRFEERCAQPLPAVQAIRGFLHLYVGEEAVATGVLDALEPDDAVVATYREHGHALLKGVPAGRGHGRDVRQGGGLLRRAGWLHAPLRHRPALLRGQRHRRPGACRSPSASPSPTACGASVGSPPASSARAPWPRASSTSA